MYESFDNDLEILAEIFGQVDQDVSAITDDKKTDDKKEHIHKIIDSDRESEKCEKCGWLDEIGLSDEELNIG